MSFFSCIDLLHRIRAALLPCHHTKLYVGENQRDFTKGSITATCHHRTAKLLVNYKSACFFRPAKGCADIFAGFFALGQYDATPPLTFQKSQKVFLFPFFSRTYIIDHKSDVRYYMRFWDSRDLFILFEARSSSMSGVCDSFYPHRSPVQYINWKTITAQSHPVVSWPSGDLNLSLLDPHTAL